MKVAIIGLDCVDPGLLFGELLDDLEHVGQLVEDGIHGPARSSQPPTTVPAWSVLASGKNPGQLGFTGMQNRRFRQTRKGLSGDYYASFLAFSDTVDEPRLWDIAGEAGKRVVCLNVPQTYPPNEVNGVLVSGPMTPNHDGDWTHPPDVAGEIHDLVGEFPHGRPDAGDGDLDTLAERVRERTAKRFEVARHLSTTREWDLFFTVETGPARVHEALWSRVDPDHPAQGGDDARRAEVLDYYRALDAEIGRLLDTFDDDTAVLVVSDHGARASHGSVRLNDWLRREGYLTLHETPDAPEGFDPGKVDWTRTRAWAQGGHVGRVHLNVEGREPSGVVDTLSYEALRDELRDALERMKDPDGNVLGNRVLKPQEVYTGPHTDRAPDLLCYAGGLRYRVDDGIGHDAIVSPASALDPRAVNDYQGVFVLADPEGRFSGQVKGMTLLDGVPTVLELMGLPVPSDVDGRVLRPDGGLHKPS